MPTQPRPQGLQSSHGVKGSSMSTTQWFLTSRERGDPSTVATTIVVPIMSRPPRRSIHLQVQLAHGGLTPKLVATQRQLNALTMPRGGCGVYAVTGCESALRDVARWIVKGGS